MLSLLGGFMVEFVTRAIPLQRGPAHVSYLVSLTFGDISSLLTDQRLYIPNQADLPDFAQRKLNPTRIKAIARYILDTYLDGTTFFPPICINVQPAPRYVDGHIYMPYNAISLRLTDGQHRCLGIQRAIQEMQSQESISLNALSCLEIGALLYAGLPLEEERQAFRDQNLLVQRPGTSLSHLFDQRSPIVLMAKELMVQVPHFQDNIETVENSLSKSNSKLLTLSTLVSSTQHMFPNLKSQKHLPELTSWAVAFWQATAKVLPEDPWVHKTAQERSQQRQESLVGSAVVFQALGMLARDLYLEEALAEDLVRWVARLQELDWRRDNRSWLEHGITQVGANGLIISNTKTTIDACHRILREVTGVHVAGATA
jgi:DGQHR domain-containing protein